MKKLFSPLLAIFLISCTYPESDGKKAAKNENRCAEKCIEAAQKLESDFVNHFNPKDYSLRSQAVDMYKKQFKRIGEDSFAKPRQTNTSE